MGTCIVLYGMLWRAALVGCGCAFRMADCPRVENTVHCQFARVLYFAVEIAVVQELFVGYSGMDVV